MADQPALESHVHCPLCRNVFDHPKALPCLHTFCQACLEEYISRTGDSVRFPCPACRQIIYVPGGGVWSFPDNNLLLHLAATSHGSPTVSDPSSTIQSDQLPTYQTLFGGKAFDWENSDVVVVNNSNSEAVLLHKFSQYGIGDTDFTHVSGLEVNTPTKDIIAADCSQNKVVIFNSKGEHKSHFFADCSIRDLCVTKLNTLLISVSRSGAAILREYSMDGHLVGSYGSFYKYDNPCGIAVDCAQRIIVTSLEKNTVHVLTAHKKPFTNFGSKGSGPNHFIQPSYVAVNNRNEIVVSDSANHRIKVHEINGRFLHQMGSQGHVYGQLFYPMGLAVDVNDNIYVADANNYRVQVFTREGEFIACPVRRTFDIGVDVKPTNVALSQNRVIVALRGSRRTEIRIYKWDIPTVHMSDKAGLCCAFLSCCRKSDNEYEEI